MRDIQLALERYSFLWTITSIGCAVEAVSIPIITEAVENVVAGNRTPAYDILGYFHRLSCGEELTMHERRTLARLYRDHRDEFVRRVLSIWTQLYMNTHRSDVSVEQSLCELLGIQYKPRRRAIGMRIR